MEVIFRELKQHLGFGSGQSRDFDAQIANATTSMILYIFLSYYRRISAYETVGELFRFIKDDLCEKNLAQRLWGIFEDLLQVVIDVISKNGKVDITSFKTSPEYAMVKNLFESSFLTNQLLQINNAA